MPRRRSDRGDGHGAGGAIVATYTRDVPRRPECHPDIRRPSAPRAAIGKVSLRRRATGAPVPAILLAGLIALAGCTPAGQDAEPLTTTAVETATPSASPSPSPGEPTGPVLIPDGTAEDNLPLFSSIVAAVWATPQQVTGQAYVDALVAAGFDKAAMQLTPDRSTVGNPAESIQFSVRWGQDCLVGQVGPATGEPVAVIVPVLAEGTCLVGQTRPIDW